MKKPSDSLTVYNNYMKLLSVKSSWNRRLDLYTDLYIFNRPEFMKEVEKFDWSDFIERGRKILYRIEALERVYHFKRSIR